MLTPRKLFQPAARYPADPRAVFILALSVFSGVGSLIAQTSPGTLEAVMPRWGIIIWGVTLTIGSVLALTGLAFDNDNGIITEQIGSVMVGAATVFYSLVALKVAGLEAAQPIIIILAWGLACFVRWLQLQLLIRDLAQDRLTHQIRVELHKQADEEE